MEETNGVGNELEPAATAAAEVTEVWTCGRVVNERDEIICGVEAVDEVLIRNDAGLFGVPLCKYHKEEHYKFYERRRAAKAAQTRQGNTGAFRAKGEPFRAAAAGSPMVGEVQARNGSVLVAENGAVT